MAQETTGNQYAENLFKILSATLLTGLMFVFSRGISGNDFWWHVKAGEWMVNNLSLPGVDVFSWYARENGIVWVSHEWLSQIVFHLIYRVSAEPGIFIFSFTAAVLMMLLILFRNKTSICLNLLSATLFLAPMIQLFTLFYGRPHVFSYYLIYLTILCLYDFKNNENSRKIFLIPLFAILWANLHAGSSTLCYILCFIFFAAGLFDFSWGKLKFEKNSKKQARLFLCIGIISLAAIGINPYGTEMIIYPYANMGDAFMQEIIDEWQPPDAKNITHVLVFFLPVLICLLNFIVTEKKIKAVDLLLFLFFSYMFFRSVRFAIVFAIACSFFAFDYAIPRQTSPKAVNDRKPFFIVCGLLVIINISLLGQLIKTHQSGKLISVALDKEFIEFVKTQQPKRLYNDYNFGETLIFNGIETFADARADLFSPHNLKDMLSLFRLVQSDPGAKEKFLNVQSLIDKYNFDAFLLRSNSSLSSYLRARPESFPILKESEKAIYFSRASGSFRTGGQQQ